MKFRKVEIIEDAEGWTVRGPAVPMVYQSALEALLAIKQQDADQKEGRVTVIEWSATSRIGRAVLAVIAK